MTSRDHPQTAQLLAGLFDATRRQDFVDGREHAGDVVLGQLGAAEPGLDVGAGFCGDVHVHDNLLYNTGIYGIDVEGYAQATSPEFVGLEILNNQIVDDRGAGSQLQWGVYVNAYTDKPRLCGATE